MRDCPKPPQACSHCGKLGHDAANCWFAPQKSGHTSVGSRPTNQMNQTKPKLRVSGKVFAMTGEEAAASDELIGGKGTIQGKLVDILYDSGATHSFISTNCVENLSLKTTVMPYIIRVSTPVDGVVETNYACLDCTICTNGREFRVDLVCMPFFNLDVVLGMDWLAANHVLLDCNEKTITFKEKPEVALNHLSLTRLSPVVSAKAYMVTFSTEDEAGIQVKNVPVVSEFPGVFPEDISELPPEREVEFSIDLVPGASPISIAPYRMAPMELAEVKR